MSSSLIFPEIFSSDQTSTIVSFPSSTKILTLETRAVEGPSEFYIIASGSTYDGQYGYVDYSTFATKLGFASVPDHDFVFYLDSTGNLISGDNFYSSQDPGYTFEQIFFGPLAEIDSIGYKKVFCTFGEPISPGTYPMFCDSQGNEILQECLSSDVPDDIYLGNYVRDGCTQFSLLAVALPSDAAETTQGTSSNSLTI